MSKYGAPKIKSLPEGRLFIDLINFAYFRRLRTLELFWLA